jgi:BMFP domain-containing protein YqiC
MSMPQNIVDQISHTIDTKIVPETAVVHRKIEALSKAQVSSLDTITRSVQEIARTTAEAIERKRLENLETTSKLECHLERLLISQETFSDTETNLCAKLENIHIPRPTSIEMIIPRSQGANTETSHLLRSHPFGDRSQSSSLRKKLDRVGSSIGAVGNSLEYLSTFGVKLDADISQSEIKRAVQNIIGSIWMLLSSLQLLIRELV